MCVIYLMQEGSKGYKDQGRFVIERKDGTKSSVPLNDVESVVIAQHAQVTTQTIFEMLRRKVPVFYIDRDGKLVGTLTGGQGSLHMLERQFYRFNNDKICLALAKEIVRRKVAAQVALLKYYKKRNKSEVLMLAIKELDGMQYGVGRVTAMDKLRGFEGIAARHYFSAFSEIITAPGWQWHGRRKHPAADPVNALLGYGYWFLEREVRIALVGTGLDCRIGFMHTNNGRKDSLVYDMMEPFRQKIIDRFVLTLINKKVMTPENFYVEEGRCYLTAEGKTKWIVSYEEYMNKPVKEYGEQSPRQWILAEVQKFDRHIKEISSNIEKEGESRCDM